jgi:hypothetical protein
MLEQIAEVSSHMHKEKFVSICVCKHLFFYLMLSIPLCIIIQNKSINQIAVQHNYLLK